MARRRIGQEQLTIMGSKPRGGTSLDEVAQLVGWTELERLLGGVSAAVKGEPGWPPLALFRALLLATWHDLSDVRFAEALNDRASFRRFCGFAAHEQTPERTALVRFRRVLIRLKLDRVLFKAVTRQFDAQRILVRTGALVDATLIPSASIKHDGEAKWAGHRRRKPMHGYKAHISTDQEAGLIRGVEVTTANGHDAACLEAVLPPVPGDVHGDSAFANAKSDRIILGKGGRPCTVQTGVWGGPDALVRLKAQNGAVQRVLLPHREGVRHGQAQLRPSSDALARAGKGGAAGAAYRHRLQSAPQLAIADAALRMTTPGLC